MRFVVVALAVAGLATSAAAQGAAGEPATRDEPQEARATERDPILDRDPRGLPRAAAERWRDWQPGSEVPEATRADLARALDAWRRSDAPGALRGLFAALEIEPDYPPAVHQLGVVYFRMQRYGDAAVAFERFLEVAPARVADTRGLAHAWYSLGDYERSREHYRAVLEAAPQDAEAVRGLALSEMRLGRLDAALHGLDRVLVMEPTHADAATWRARILWDAERVEEALAAAEHARDLGPYRPQAWFVLGQALLELERYEEGEAARARFQELDEVEQSVRVLEHRLLYRSTDLQLLARLAELHRSVGNVPETRRALARMVALRPDDPDLRIRVLDTLVVMGDVEGAHVAAMSMEQAFPKDVETWKRLEAYWGRRGDVHKQVQAGERWRRLSGGR